ncbi:MAG: hypothetical protein ACI4XQ_06300 [Eubacteriales bacterium]
MKKIMPALLVLCILLSAAACAKIGDAGTEDMKGTENTVNTGAAQTESSGSVSDESEEYADEEYIAPAVFLEADTWDIKVGERAQVTFTAELDGATGVPELYLGEDKVADFVCDGEKYRAVLTLENDRRGRRTYCAVCGDERSNGVTVSFVSDETDAEAAEMKRLLDEVETAYIEKAPALNPTSEELAAAAAATKAILDSAAEQGIVAGYTPEYTGYTVEFTNGITKVLELYSYEDYWSSEMTGEALAKSLEEGLDGCVMSINRKRKIALIQPYYSEDSCSEMEQACRYVSDSYDNFELVIIRNIDLEMMKHLDDFDIVLWEGHGGFSAKRNSPFIIIPVEEKVTDGTVLYNKENDTAYIFADFFDRYYSAGDFDGMFFYFGSCCSAKTGDLYDVIMSKGAKAFIGFSAPVGEKYNHKIAESIFKNIGAGRTGLSAAMETTKLIYGEQNTNFWNYWNWISAIDGNPVDFIASYDTFFEKPVYIHRGEYTVPTDLREYEIPGLIFASNYNWGTISEYDWDTVYTFDVFVEDRTWYDWVGICSSGTTETAFYFLGDEGDEFAVPISVMVTTMAGVINGYDDAEFMTGLHCGMTYEETESWLNSMWEKTYQTPVTILSEGLVSDEYMAGYYNENVTVADGLSGAEVFFTFMFNRNGNTLYGVRFTKGEY